MLNLSEDIEWRDCIFVKAIYSAHEIQKNKEKNFYFVANEANGIQNLLYDTVYDK